MKHQTEFGVGWTWTLGRFEAGIGWVDEFWLPFRMPRPIRRRFTDLFIGPTDGNIAFPVGRGRSFYFNWKPYADEPHQIPMDKIA